MPRITRSRVAELAVEGFDTLTPSAAASARTAAAADSASGVGVFPTGTVLSTRTSFATGFLAF